jgi:hypothetical protein
MTAPPPQRKETAATAHGARGFLSFPLAFLAVSPSPFSLSLSDDACTGLEKSLVPSAVSIL